MKKFDNLVRTLLALGVMVLMLVGCNRGTIIKHYVTAYKLSLYDSSSKDVVLTRSNTDGSFYVLMKGDKRVSWESSDAEELKSYNALARKNSDLGWGFRDDREINWLFSASAFPIVDVTATALTDWDENTPKGSSLDERFLFDSDSPDEFIKNGYKLDKKRIEEEIEKVPAEFRNYLKGFTGGEFISVLPVFGRLSDINFKQYRLLGIKSVMWFKLIPIGDYNAGAEIEIVVTLEDGTVLKYHHKMPSKK